MQPFTFEPMSAPQMVDQAFRLYRLNFSRFLAIVAVIQIPLGLLSMVVQNQLHKSFEEVAQLAAFVLLLLLWGLLTLLGQSLCSAALIKGVSECYLGGEVTVGKAYRYILPKLFTIIMASILLAVIMFLGVLFCVLPGIIFMLWFSVTIQAIVLEDLDPVQGIKRSRELARGNLSHVFLVGLLAFLISVLAQASGMFVAALVSFVTPAGEQPLMVLQQFLPLAAGIVVQPVTAGSFILLYYDLRMRKEGFDLEMRARGRTSADAPAEANPAC